MTKWSLKWQLPFNIGKCKCMHYGNSVESVYTMNDNEIEAVVSERDLGVMFDDKLKFSDHIRNIVSKANSRVGIIKRNFSNLSPDILLPLYKGLVRPLLEYCSIIWCPILKQDLVEIEKVQRRATKMVPTISDKSYHDRLKILNLDSLAFRRRRNDMLQVFRIFAKIDNLEINN